MKAMKLTDLLLLLLFILILTGCASGKDATVTELPMLVGIEKSKDYKLTPSDRQFITSQTAGGSVSKERAAQFFIQNGFHLHATGNLREAMKQFNRAWIIDGDNLNVYWGYSLILLDQHQYCDAMETLNIAVSKGYVINKFLSDAAFIISACIVVNNGFTAQEESEYLLRANKYYKKAISFPNVSKDEVHDGWKEILLSDGIIGDIDKVTIFNELTGHALTGKPVNYLTDDLGRIMGFVPFDGSHAYGLGEIVDYGYSGLKHRLLFSIDDLEKYAKSGYRDGLEKHFDADRQKGVVAYSDKEKEMLLNTIKRQLIDNAQNVSVKAKAAINNMIDFEVVADHVERIVAADYQGLRYSLIKALPPYAGTTRIFSNDIDGAKKPLVITGVDLFSKARIVVRFAESVTRDAKSEILKNADFDSVGLSLDSSGNMIISYDAPSVVAFRAVEFDKGALHHYMKRGRLPVNKR